MPEDATPAGLSVRRAVAAEASAIAHVRIETWRHAYSGLMPASVLLELDEEKSADFFKSAIEIGGNENCVLSGYRGDQLCGFALWNRHSEEPEQTAELRALYVLPDHQGCGLGRLLLAETLREASAAGYKHLAVFALEANQAAANFYRSAGAAPLSYQRTYEIAGLSLPEVGFVWTLAQRGA